MAILTFLPFAAKAVDTEFTTTLNGSSPTWNRGSGGAGGYAYLTITIVPTVTGSYSIINTASNLTITNDPYIYVFKDSFDPALNPYSNPNYLDSDDDGGDGLLFRIDGLSLTAGLTYVLVPTVYREGSLGSFTFNISGAGSVSYDVVGGTTGGGTPPASDITDPSATYLSSGLGTTVNPVIAGGTLTVNQDTTYAQDFTVANGEIDSAGKTVTFTGVFSDADAATPGLLVISNSNEGGSLTLAGASTFSGEFQVGENASVILSGSIASQNILIATGGSLDDVNGGLSTTATVDNAGTFNIGADQTIATLTNSGKITGSATLTASTYALNDGSIIDANLGSGTLTTNGEVALNGTAAASSVSVESGRLLLGSPDRLSSTAAVTNAAVLDLGGDQTVASLTNSGQITGEATLTASTYALNDGSVINANLGAGGVTTNGAVILNGTSAATSVSIESGSLSLGSADRLTSVAVVDNKSVLSLGGDQTIASLTNSGQITGEATLTASTYALNDGSLIDANLGAGSVTSNGVVLLNGASSASSVSIESGSLSLGSADRLSSAAAVDNAAVLDLGGDQTVATLTNSGKVTGSATLTATTYALNDGSVIDAHLGAGSIFSNGSVLLNGTSGATSIVIESGSLSLGGADLLSHDATVEINFDASLVLTNGNNTIANLLGEGGVSLLNGSILTVLNGDFSGSASSTGAFEKTGEGTLTLSGSNTYEGGTTVREGQLAIAPTGSLNSDVTVDAAGWLAQNGTINGNVTNNGRLTGSGQIVGDVENFGTLAPGNSPGVLSIVGNYTENGTLEIEIGGTAGPGVNPNGHDQVQVTGTATINPGSTLTLVKFTAFEAARGDVFTVIDAAGGLTGNFSTLDRTSFDTQLYFDPRTGIVYGTGLAEGESFSAFNSGNRNASAIGAALYSVGLTEDSNGTYKAFVDSSTPMGAAVVALLTGASTLDTLNALSPEAYAGLADYGLYVTRNYARQAATAPVLSVTDGWQLSAAYAGYSNGSDSSLNSADYDLRSNGAVVSVSRAAGRGFAIGAFVAADDSRVESSRLSAEGDGYAAGLFASYLPKPDSALSFDANAGYGKYSFDADRRSLSGSAMADDIDSKAYTVELNAHYRLLRTNRTQVSALLGAAYTHVTVDGFTEAGPEALVVGENRDELFSGQVGFEARASITARFSVSARATYEHNFSKGHRDVDATFAAGGPSFTVRAPGFGEDTINLGVGASYLITDRVTISAYYNGGFADDTDLASSFGARLGYRF